MNITSMMREVKKIHFKKYGDETSKSYSHQANKLTDMPNWIMPVSRDLRQKLFMAVVRVCGQFLSDLRLRNECILFADLSNLTNEALKAIFSF